MVTECPICYFSVDATPEDPTNIKGAKLFEVDTVIRHAKEHHSANLVSRYNPITNEVEIIYYSSKNKERAEWV